MDRYVKEKFKELVLEGNFFEAKKIINNFAIDDLSDTLCEIADDSKNISFYSFVCFLLIDKELPEYHIMASQLLIIPFSYIIGAYNAALYHARRALELDPLQVDYKEYLLFFYDIPDRLISRKEALKIAYEILEKNPHSEPALSVLQRVD